MPWLKTFESAFGPKILQIKRNLVKMCICVSQNSQEHSPTFIALPSLSKTNLARLGLSLRFRLGAQFQTASRPFTLDFIIIVSQVFFVSVVHSLLASVTNHRLNMVFFDHAQGGSGAGLALTCCPTCRVTKMEAHLFRVTLMRRLQLSLSLTVRTCRCGLPFDALATTVQRARVRGFWGSEGELWRVLQHGSAAKVVVE